jgi:hypothetical protein
LSESANATVVRSLALPFLVLPALLAPGQAESQMAVIARQGRAPAARATLQQPEVSGDEYAVWAAVIDDMFARGRARLLVIDDHTVNDQSRALERQDYLRRHFPSVSKEDIGDFVNKNRELHQLRDTFKTEVKHVLVKKEEIRQIFKAGLDGWEEFYRRFPDSGGVVGMSRPGFNTTMNQAFVYIEHSCGGLCGTGYYLLLVQGDGKWTVAKRLVAWMS